MSYSIFQIDGWENLTGGWFPRIPQILWLAYDSTNYISTWQINKRDVNKDIVYIDDNKNILIANAINNGAWQADSSARDATNPYVILFAYNYVTDTIILREGTPAAIPVAPVLQANELLIGYVTEPNQAGGAPTVIPGTSSNLFGVKEIFSSSNALTLEFGSANPISHNYITLTENITGTIDFIGDIAGKTLVLQVDATGSYSITWDSADGFYLSDTSTGLSTDSGHINIFTITKNDFTDDLNPKFAVDNMVVDFS